MPSPNRLGTSGGIQSQRLDIGGSGVQPSPTRVETEFMPHDSPLPTGHTVGSDEGSLTLKELMDTCTTLTKQVSLLKKELAQTKEDHARDIHSLKTEIQGLKDQLQKLNGHRSARLILSSSSHETDSTPEGDDLGDSPK